MKVVGQLIGCGIALLISGVVLMVLIWPFALISDEANRSYSIGSAIIYVLIVFGQLVTITFVAFLHFAKSHLMMTLTGKAVFGALCHFSTT